MLEFINQNDKPVRKLTYQELVFQGPLRYSEKPVILMPK